MAMASSDRLDRGTGLSHGTLTHAAAGKVENRFPLKGRPQFCNLTGSPVGPLERELRGVAIRP